MFMSRRCHFWINKNSQNQKLTDIHVSVTGSDQCYRGGPGSRLATSDINVLTLTSGTQ